MQRFGTKNLTESNIQKLNEVNVAAFQDQALLSVPASIVQVGIDMLNKSAKQIVAAAATETGNRFKASAPVVLKRDETKGTKYYQGPISIYSLEIGGQRIGDPNRIYQFFDFHNSDPNDESQDQGVKDGEHYLNQYLSARPDFITELAERYARGIRNMFKEVTWTVLVPGLYVAELYPGDIPKSSQYKRNTIKPAVTAAAAAAGEAVAKQILARAKKFVAINKQQIAGVSSQTAG
jgi:hypothetical protein